MLEGSYLHQVQYYETDGMRIVHHSNYLRWFEEARMDAIAKAGFPYEELERRGIVIPALTVSCTYKVPVVYGQTVAIYYGLDNFKGVRFGLCYQVYSADDQRVLHAEGRTTHCFLNQDMKPLNIRKAVPELYQWLTA